MYEYSNSGGQVPLSKCVFSMRMSAAVLASCSIVIGHSTTDIAGMAAQALRLKWKALHFIFTGSEHSSASHHEQLACGLAQALRICHGTSLSLSVYERDASR